MKWPDPGYVAPPAPVKVGAAPAKAVGTIVDWAPSEILKVPQFFGLLFMCIGSSQAGLLIIANAAPLLAKTAGELEFFVRNSWILASFAGLLNAVGRPGTGFYSDKIGRRNAFALNGFAVTLILFLMPLILKAESVFWLFLVLGITLFQYGGTLALMPAYTADFFGPKNLGMNYGLVYIGWGIAFLVPFFAGYIKDWTGAYDLAFYLSGVILLLAVIVSWVNKRPMHVTE